MTSQFTTIGFTGAYRDSVSAGYPLGNGYRWYLPSLLRFNAPDEMSPFGIGGLNAYAYCGDDPINRIDPTGRGFMSAIGRAFRSAMRAAPELDRAQLLASSEESLAVEGAIEASGDMRAQGEPSHIPLHRAHDETTQYVQSFRGEPEPHHELSAASTTSVAHVPPLVSSRGEGRLWIGIQAEGYEGLPQHEDETIELIRDTFMRETLSLYTQMSTELWTEFDRPLGQYGGLYKRLAQHADALTTNYARLADVGQRMSRNEVLRAHPEVFDELSARLWNSVTVYNYYVAKYERQRIWLTG